jgi:hypothetical protein
MVFFSENRATVRAIGLSTCAPGYAKSNSGWRRNFGAAGCCGRRWRKIVTDRYFGSHEFRGDREEIKSSSDRRFGFVFACFFLLLSGLSIYSGHGRWMVWLPLAAVFGVIAYLQPRLLAPLNRLWTQFGLILNRIVSPLVLGMIFYGSIVPIGYLMRITGKDPLHRSFEPASGSYWILREPPGPVAGTFKNQY